MKEKIVSYWELIKENVIANKKKYIVILLVVIALFSCLSFFDVLHPSRRTIKKDAIECYFHGDIDERFDDIKTKVLLADKKDGIYYATVKLSYMYWDDIVGTPEEKVVQLEYKHYDKGGWVLENSDYSTYYDDYYYNK